MPVGNQQRNMYQWQKSYTFNTLTLFDIYLPSDPIAKVFTSSEDKKIYVEMKLKKYGPFNNTTDAKNAIFGLILDY